MRILILLIDLFDKVGGIQTFNRCFVKAINSISQDKNCNVSILVLNDNGKNLNQKHYIQSSNVSYRGFKGNKISYVLESINEAKNYDVIVFGHANLLPIAFFMSYKKASKKYLIAHGIDVWGKLSALKLLGVSKIDNILSVSRFTSKEMIKHNNIPQERIVLIHDTLDPLYVAKNKDLKSKEELLLPEGQMILTVSRLDKREKYKNIELAIKAMPQILKEVPGSYFVIVGEGSDRGRLMEIANNLNLNDKVIFTGSIAEINLASYFNLCDLFVLPSTGEGFGVVFLEAMYHGKPCIGANAGGVPEVIEDGVTGMLCKPSDINSLTTLVTKLLKDKNLSTQMGLAGKRRLENNFSFTSFGDSIERILTGHLALNVF